MLCWILFLGQLGTNGFECPAQCPVICPADQMTCPGLGFDETGCKIADFCAPKKGIRKMHKFADHLCNQCSCLKKSFHRKTD